MANKEIDLRTVKRDSVERFELNERDKEMVEYWLPRKGIASDIAYSVQRQGWISYRQRKVLTDRSRLPQYPYSGKIPTAKKRSHISPKWSFSASRLRLL